MRRLPLATAMLVAALVASPARSQETQQRPIGYEFGKPRLLTQQLLWGLAHGVKLLATACRDEESGAEAIAKAYTEWLDRYRERIDNATRDLSRHYFRQDAVSAEELIATLHLKTELGLRPDELSTACASFVEVIEAPRYDLELFYVLRQDAARVERAEVVRARVAACLKKLAAESVVGLEASFSAWAQANELVESVSRSRLFTHKGDSADDRQWRHDAGAGAVPPAVTCEQLAGALTERGYALSNAFEDGSR